MGLLTAAKQSNPPLLSLVDSRSNVALNIIERIMDEQDFRRHADTSLEALKRSLYEAEGEADFEVEENAGALHIAFEEPPAKFIVSPNAPARQIWISALSTSFKLDWSDAKQDFELSKTGEGLKTLVCRLINEQLGEDAIRLK